MMVRFITRTRATLVVTPNPGIITRTPSFPRNVVHFDRALKRGAGNGSLFCSNAANPVGKDYKARSWSDKIGAAVFLGMSAVTFGLGTWQAKRYSWKVDLVDLRKNRLCCAESPLPPSAENKINAETSETASEDWMYRRVICSGDFDYENSILLGPRSPPKGSKALSKSAVSPSGYFLITPLRQKNGETVLVNQGWIPKELVDQKSGEVKKQLSDSFEKGVVTVSAVVAPSEYPGALTPENRVDERIFFWLDAKEMRRICNAPATAWLIDLIDSKHSTSSYPAPRPVNSYMDFKVSPYTHVGYSATWYGLCLTGLAVTRFRFLR
mmetsp:Transcript_15097/g.17095  ORF Transcript_15097/g.17095 Transcript_15097/m.17095 type:complete len:324 (+) Transcript_15097:80-1051(+)